MSPNRKHSRASKSGRRNKVRLLCYPLFVAIAIRTIGAVSLFQILSLEGKFSTPWMDSNPTLIPVRWNWLWLFNAWDSLQFPRIAMFGYDHPNFVYLPGYPVLIRFAGLLTGDYWFGAFLVTQIFALGSIVVFQLLASEYMQPLEAAYATILMATFPLISVFTTLGYSEAVFLFLSLSSWYFFKKRRIRTSSLLAGFTSVTRIYGFAIVLPMFLDIVKSKRYRELLYLVIPAAFIASWLLFCYLSTGDPIVSWTDEKYWQKEPGGEGIRLVQAIIHQGLRGVILCCSGLDPTIFCSVSLFVILVVMTWKVDRSLWAYAVIVSGLLIFTTTSFISLPRYLAFIFPVWLSVRVRNPIVVAVCVALLVPMILIVWLYAIAVSFVG